MMFGAVQFINNNPILDGMVVFDTKPECIEYVKIQEGLGLSFQGIVVKWTIIRLEKR